MNRAAPDWGRSSFVAAQNTARVEASGYMRAEGACSASAPVSEEVLLQVESITEQEDLTGMAEEDPRLAGTEEID